MTDADVDISQLTAEQQLALQQFTSVTDQEITAAIPLLQRCQWNVQIAISRFFDGEPPDPVVEPPLPRPQDPRRQQTLLNDFDISERRSISGDRSLEPAPRIVPQPESQVTHQAPLLLSVIFAPFNFAYGLLGRYFRLIGYFFPFIPRLWSSISSPSAQARRKNTSGRRPLSPRDSAARFIREFEEEYGSHQLSFFEGGYAQALDIAKKDLKFLLVVLVSPEHDDTSSFIKDTFLSQEVSDFLKNNKDNLILWAGNVQDSEAYQVSTAFNCTKFPFACLVCHAPSVSSTSMSIIVRITGPTPPRTFVSKLQSGISQHSEPLNRVRATRAEQQATRNLREAQNTAYERSLAIDRERAKQKREAEERKKREEEEAKQREDALEQQTRNLEQWRKWKTQSIPTEPGSDIKDVVRISLRMPSGDRVIRRFASDAPIEELYAFVECYDLLNSEEPIPETEKPVGFEHEYKFQLVSPMPREVYHLDAGGSLKQRIGRSGNLIVETLDEEDDDDVVDSESA